MSVEINRTNSLISNSLHLLQPGFLFGLKECEEARMKNGQFGMETERNNLFIPFYLYIKSFITHSGGLKFSLLPR